MQMPDRTGSRRGDRLRRAIAGALVLAGLTMLAWSAVLIIDARLSQETAQRSLEIAARLESPGRPVAEDDATSPPVALVARGSPIGELLIPRVRLSSIVLHGSDVQTLRRGPGHIEDTAFPGEHGNTAIAGHRDTFFRQLRDVRVGDDVFVNTPRGSFHYEITSTRVVNAHDLSVLESTESPALTLITCYPFWVLGPAPDRFVVRATLVKGFTLDIPAKPLTSRSISWRALSAAPVTPEAGPRRLGETVTVIAPQRTDDSTLVRLAIERFRSTYNGRLVRHNERRPGGLLTFTGCDVAIAGNEAHATCTTKQNSPEDAIELWIVELHHAADTWAIKSTAVASAPPFADDATREP